MIKNVDQRKPTFYNTASINGLSGYQISGIFPYRDYLVVVGLKDKTSTKSLTQCEYDLVKSLKCYPESQKSTKVTSGLVGIDLKYKIYYEADPDNYSLNTYLLEGDFNSVDWNTRILYLLSGLRYSTKGYLRDLTESNNVIAICQTDSSNQDVSSTIVGHDKQMYPLLLVLDGSAVVPNQLSLIVAYPPGDKTNVGILRIELPYGLIRGTDLQVGDNKITVSMQDPDMPDPVSVDGVYIKLKSVYDQILISGSG